MKLLILLCLLSFPVHSWELPKNETLILTSQTLMLLDWGQTRYAAKHPERFKEGNVFLGDHPSLGDVNRYFTGLMIGNYLMYKFLPEKSNGWIPAKRNYLIAMNIGQGLAVGWNFSIGVKLSY